MSITRKECYKRVKLLAELLGFKYNQRTKGFTVVIRNEAGSISAYALSLQGCHVITDYSVTYRLGIAKPPITIRDIDKRFEYIQDYLVELRKRINEHDQ